MESIDDPTRERSLSNLGQGAFLLIEGARFIRRERRLWLLAVVPVLFALLGVGSATALFFFWLDGIHGTWVEILPVFEVEVWWNWVWVGPGRVLVWLIGWLAVLASFALTLVGGLLLANLASAPFLDQLSQRVEAIVSGTSGPTSSRGLVREALGSFGSELQRLVFLASIWVGLSLLGFVVPGGQLITGPVLIALTILFLPLDYAGFALDRRGLSFGRRRTWLLENRSLMLGFGGVAFVACLVPGLNLLILPAQVTAGTLLVLRRRPAA
jgi:CysZ protein